MKEYSQYFEVANRPDGSSFIRKTEGCPTVIDDLVCNIHFDYFDGCFPNDWIYQIILEAFEAFELGDDLEDICLEPDVYYVDLHRWLTNPFAHGLCDEVIQEYWHSPTRLNFTDIISYAQVRAKRMIYDAVDEFLQQQEKEGCND